MSAAKTFIQRLLADAGVELNGPNPWDLRVHDEAFYDRVARGGNLALGEAYMDGWWDCPRLDELACRVLSSDLDYRLRRSPGTLLRLLPVVLFNLPRRRAYAIGETHYDTGNDLFEVMLDARLTYTCGYWRDARTLDAAQEAKLDLVCRKLGLEPGQRVLDIGCGWGSFAKFAAERYGASVVGITVSREQLELGQALCAGLPVELRLQSYTELARQRAERFDHVVSLGMFEHVGYRNYRRYFETVRRTLCDGGLFLLHTIGNNHSARVTDPWINRYIFPNSMLPSIAQVGSAIEGLFVMEDWHNFGADYDKTLMAWHENVARGWPRLQSRYPRRFQRMWTYFLLTCAGAFRARRNQLWQVVLSKRGVPGGVASAR